MNRPNHPPDPREENHSVSQKEKSETDSNKLVGPQRPNLHLNMGPPPPGFQDFRHGPPPPYMRDGPPPGYYGGPMPPPGHPNHPMNSGHRGMQVRGRGGMPYQGPNREDFLQQQQLKAQNPNNKHDTSNFDENQETESKKGPDGNETDKSQRGIEEETDQPKAKDNQPPMMRPQSGHPGQQLPLHMMYGRGGQMPPPEHIRRMPHGQIPPPGMYPPHD